ncbi:MAG: hypothetical protein AB7N71_01995 [Phycisphaerae bacterium]
MSITTPAQSESPSGNHRRAAWKILRLGFVAVLGLATVILLPLYNRETQALRADSKTLEVIRGILQERLEKGGSPPLSISLPTSAADARFREAYYYDGLFDQRAAERGTAVVACLRNPIMGLLKRDGRNVLLFDGKEFEVRWLNEDKFRELAARQNLNIAPPEQKRRN